MFERRIMKLFICILMSLTLMVTGCAVGSATAAYSLEAGTANKLSSVAEERLIKKIEERFKYWQAENK